MYAAVVCLWWIPEGRRRSTFPLRGCYVVPTLCVIVKYPNIEALPTQNSCLSVSLGLYTVSLSYELISEPAFEYALLQAGNKKWQQVFGITQGLNHAVGCAVLSLSLSLSLSLAFWLQVLATARCWTTSFLLF